MWNHKQQCRMLQKSLLIGAPTCHIEYPSAVGIVHRHGVSFVVEQVGIEAATGEVSLYQGAG
jgi:hypothetical protein